MLKPAKLRNLLRAVEQYFPLISQKQLQVGHYVIITSCSKFHEEEFCFIRSLRRRQNQFKLKNLIRCIVQNV